MVQYDLPTSNVGAVDAIFLKERDMIIYILNVLA